MKQLLNITGEFEMIISNIKNDEEISEEEYRYVQQELNKTLFFGITTMTISDQNHKKLYNVELIATDNVEYDLNYL